MSGPTGPWKEQLQGLGLQLRQSRESQGLEAETIADRLRIGVEQLQALENAELDRLPEPVFVIAQARRVAGALNLDIEPQLAALRNLGDGTHGSHKPAARSAHTPSRQSQPSGRLIPLSLLTLLVIGAGVWGIRQGLEARRPGAPRSSAPASTRATAASPTPTRPAKPAVKPAEQGSTLVLTSSRPSWVQVRRVNGVTLFEGLLQGSRNFPIGEGIEVLAGRPDLVEARLGAGPSRVLGPISDVKWQRFGRTR